MDSCLEQLHDAITTATRGMTTKELTRRPKGKWSCAEILEHLYLTYTGTVKGFERCWEAGKPLAGSLTLKQRLAIALVVDAGYFPEGRQAPERTRPKGMPAEKVVAEVRQQIAQMDEWIGKCEARYGRRTKLLDHPFFGALTAQQWRKFHWVHGRHHVQQIMRLRDQQVAR
ncbi:MAG: hypothetical protein DMG88_17105 [Acidobacteria bacterium]|nr:MAG: hypothetical protein DMG88_17105 [Acidobacteriota bacterium]